MTYHQLKENIHLIKIDMCGVEKKSLVWGMRGYEGGGECREIGGGQQEVWMEIEGAWEAAAPSLCWLVRCQHRCRVFYAFSAQVRSVLTQVCAWHYMLSQSHALQYQQAISVYSVTVVICLVMSAGVTQRKFWEHGKNGKHQLDELKHSICDSKYHIHDPKQFFYSIYCDSWVWRTSSKM